MEGNSQADFDVALSFAGEDRAFVESVAEHLKKNQLRVFYDRFEKLYLWGKNLGDTLDEVYRLRSKYVVIFISNYYAQKMWTNHERKSALSRAIQEKREYVLPARFDNTELPGLLPTIGYIDLREETPESFASMIIQKVAETTSSGVGLKVEPAFRLPKVEAANLSDLHQEVQNLEKEIQKYISVYLVLIVFALFWFIGSQSRSVLEIVLGNNGYNIYAALMVVVLNILFTSFLIYKSLIIHEVTQFIAYVSSPSSKANYWEQWRRSSKSVTKPVRPIYTALLGVLPFTISIAIMSGIGHLIYSNPQILLGWLNPSEHVMESPVNVEYLASVLRTARLWFWMVAVLHLIPLWFVYVNAVPTNRRWNEINRLRGSDTLFDDLSSSTLPPPSHRNMNKEE